MTITLVLIIICVSALTTLTGNFIGAHASYPSANISRATSAIKSPPQTPVDKFISIHAGGRLSAIAYNPYDGNMYVSKQDSNTVSVIDSLSNNVTGNIEVGKSPVGLSYDPVYEEMYVVNRDSNTVSVIDFLPHTTTEN